MVCPCCLGHEVGGEQDEAQFVRKSFVVAAGRVKDDEADEGDGGERGVPDGAADCFVEAAGFDHAADDGVQTLVHRDGAERVGWCGQVKHRSELSRDGIHAQNEGAQGEESDETA